MIKFKTPDALSFGAAYLIAPFHEYLSSFHLPFSQSIIDEFGKALGAMLISFLSHILFKGMERRRERRRVRYNKKPDPQPETIFLNNKNSVHEKENSKQSHSHKRQGQTKERLPL